MPARATGNATVSFGLVSIPVKLYSAIEEGGKIEFNLLHAACGARVKQEYRCPTDDRVIERTEMVRGYEVSKDRYVHISDDEYKALQEVASSAIELTEFVPADTINPLYFDRSYYLGPDKGGERAYRLLARAMADTDLFGVAKYAARGKMHLVVVRPMGDYGLVLHQLHYASEVRAFADVPGRDAPEPRDQEVTLARRLVMQLASPAFDAARYHDEVRDRIQALIDQKVEGKEIVVEPAAPPEAQIVDLMEALKQSLGMAEGSKRTKKAPAKEKVARRAPRTHRARRR